MQKRSSVQANPEIQKIFNFCPIFLIPHFFQRGSDRTRTPLRQGKIGYPPPTIVIGRDPGPGGSPGDFLGSQSRSMITGIWRPIFTQNSWKLSQNKVKNFNFSKIFGWKCSKNDSGCLKLVIFSNLERKICIKDKISKFSTKISKIFWFCRGKVPVPVDLSPRSRLISEVPVPVPVENSGPGRLVWVMKIFGVQSGTETHVKKKTFLAKVMYFLSVNSFRVSQFMTWVPMRHTTPTTFILRGK